MLATSFCSFVLSLLSNSSELFFDLLMGLSPVGEIYNMKNEINAIFIGTFLYPNGFAATKRKQQFLDYIVAKGGTARVILTLKRARGHELNPEKGVSKKIPFEALGVNVKPNITLPFTFVVMTLRAFRRLWSVKMTDNNVIVAFGINIDTLLPLFWGKLIGYKIVFDIVEDFSTIQKINLKLFFGRTFPKIFSKFLASGISVISTYLYEKQENYIDRIPVELIPISAENLFIHLKATPKKQFHLLYSGTYGDKEGLPTLIEAFAEFSQYTDSARLIMTGNCPETIVDLLKKKLGSLSRVKLTGRLDDESYYQTLADADVMLMTRTNSAFSNAGFPYKLGEYLATKNPVVCTDTSDISLYLKHMESAMIVPPDDAKAIYHAICQLYDNSDLSTKIGENGWEVCRTYFNPNVNSRKFYDLLVSV